MIRSSSTSSPFSFFLSRNRKMTSASLRAWHLPPFHLLTEFSAMVSEIFVRLTSGISCQWIAHCSLLSQNTEAVCILHAVRNIIALISCIYPVKPSKFIKFQKTGIFPCLTFHPLFKLIFFCIVSVVDHAEFFLQHFSWNVHIITESIQAWIIISQFCIYHA